ncbi:hypothetical protein C8J56DRAFT_790739 [Mycena floridula]|nr:hypothetical protein C8J56DRAFT_790739 [Mycena floridula]
MDRSATSSSMNRPATSKARGTCKYYLEPRGCFNGKKCKFLHSDPAESSSGATKALTPYDQSKTCRFFSAGYCKREDKCWFLHVKPPPTTVVPEEESGEEEDLNCSICFEKPMNYGLLAGCGHIFCIGCIRQWRDPAGKSLDMTTFSKVTKQCPMCRAPSKFITPSSIFYKHGDPKKDEAVASYLASMARVPCRYFAQSKAKDPADPCCPFGQDCFYQHLNGDGTPYVFKFGVDTSMKVRFGHLSQQSRILCCLADIWRKVSGIGKV